MANEEIQAKFGADTGPVDRALRKLQGEMSGFSRSVSGYFKNAFGMFTGAIGAASIVSGIKNVVNEVERLRAQSNARGMGMGMVQDLNNIAVASGLSGEAVDTMINRWMKSVPAGTNVEKAFLSLADKLAGITDPATRAKIAIEAFGRSGVDMLRIIGEGSAGIAKMASEMSKLSDSDIAAIETLDNHLDRIQNRIKVLTGRALAMVIGGMTHATPGNAKTTTSEGEAGVAAKQAEYDAKKAARSARDAQDIKDAEKSTQAMLDAEWKRLTYEERMKALRANWLDLATKIGKQEMTRVERVKTLIELQKTEAQIEKEKSDHIKQQNEALKEQAAIRDASKSAAHAAFNLEQSRQDFTKWGVQELAEQPNNYRTTRDAREAMRQINFAKISSMIGRSDWEQLHLGNYEKLVKQNPALRSADRNPFGALEEQMREADLKLEEMLTVRGIKVTEFTPGP